MYAKVGRGELKSFNGIDSHGELLNRCNVVPDNARLSPGEAVADLLQNLTRLQITAVK